MKFWEYIGEFLTFRWLAGLLRDYKEHHDMPEIPGRHDDGNANQGGGSYWSRNSDFGGGYGGYSQSDEDFLDEQDDYDMLDDDF